MRKLWAGIAFLIGVARINNNSEFVVCAFAADRSRSSTRSRNGVLSIRATKEVWDNLMAFSAGPRP